MKKKGETYLEFCWRYVSQLQHTKTFNSCVERKEQMASFSLYPLFLERAIAKVMEQLNSPTTLSVALIIVN